MVLVAHLTDPVVPESGLPQDGCLPLQGERLPETARSHLATGKPVATLPRAWRLLIPERKNEHLGKLGKHLKLDWVLE